MVLRLLPTFCTSILYWTVYSQMGSMFVEQGRQMDCRVGASGMTVRAACPPGARRGGVGDEIRISSTEEERGQR